MGLDDARRDSERVASKRLSVIRLQGHLLRLCRVVRDGALARGLASLLVVVEPNPRLFRQTIYLDLAHRGEELRELRDSNVGRQVFYEDLHRRADARVIRAGLAKAGTPASPSGAEAACSPPPTVKSTTTSITHEVLSRDHS